jgi:hypothetical protein
MLCSVEGGSWSGTWWLPTSAETTVEGTLTLDSEEFGLSTSGSLEPPPEPEIGVAHSPWVPKNHPVVHGQLTDGRDATLLSADGLAMLAPFQTATEVWRPRVALLGAHLAASDARPFRFASIRLEHLAAFAGSPQVGGQIVQDRSTGALTRASFEAERRVLQTATIRGAVVQLLLTPTMRLSSGRAELELDVSFDVELETPSDWSTAWSDVVLPLRDLLAVLLGRAVAVTSVHLRPEAGTSVRLLLRLPAPLTTAAKPVSRHDFVLSAEGLPGGFDAALGAWWNSRHAHLSSVRELVDVLHAPHMYVDDQLVAYVRAVGPMLDEDAKAAAGAIATAEEQAWLDRVRSALPDDLREAVMARLDPKAANERHRLLALIESLGPVGKWLAGENPAEFAQRVIATRGGLAHPGSKRPTKMLSGADLVAHTVALQWLLRAALLRGMGMPLEDLHAVLRESRAAQTAHNIAATLREPTNGEQHDRRGTLMWRCRRQKEAGIVAPESLSSRMLRLRRKAGLVQVQPQDDQLSEAETTRPPIMIYNLTRHSAPGY